MRKMNKIAVLLLAMFLLCLAGCSESKKDDGKKPSDPSDPSIPITGPQSFQVTGLDRELQIRFSTLAAAQNIEAKYTLWYGTNPNRTSSENRSLGTTMLKQGGPDGNMPGLVFGTITGLTNGTTYYVWVNAVYEGLGESSYHMETGMPVPIPSVPGNITVTSGETMIEVTWDPVDYAFSYDVTYHTNSDRTVQAGRVVTKNTTEPRYMITENLDGALVNGTTYYIWVRAGNTNSDKSLYSEVISTSPEAASARPAAPGKPVVEPGKKRIKATWDAVRWAVSYELYCSNVNDSATAKLASVIDPASGEVSATIAGLDNGTQYYVWVRARNSRGLSGFSPAGTGTPQDMAVAVNFNDYSFQLGEATAEFIFAEYKPWSPFFRGLGSIQDRLPRYKETHLGNLFTDGARWYLNEYLEPGKNVDFVFLNGGYIDNVIKKGSISVGTIAGVVGPDASRDEIVILSMKGSDVKAFFDFAAAEAPRLGYSGRAGGSGGVSSEHWAIVSKEVNYTIRYPYPDSIMHLGPQGLGGTATHSLEEQAYFFGVIKPGTLKFNGADIDDNKNYRIATTDRNVGPAGFYLPMTTKGFDWDYTGIPYWRAVAEYIYDAGSVAPAIDGRIRIEGGVPGGTLGVPEGYNVHFNDKDYYEYYPELR